MKTAVCSIPTFRGRYEAVDTIIVGFESSLPDTDIGKQKLTDVTGQMLSIFTGPEARTLEIERNDLEAMVELVRRHGGQSITDLLKFNLSQSGLVVAFLNKLYRILRSQPRDLQSLFRTVLEKFAPSFQLPRETSKRQRTETRLPEDLRRPVKSPDLVKVEELGALLVRCEKLGLITELENLLGIIRTECETATIDTQFYESFLLPILTSLLSYSTHGHIDMDTARYQNLYQTVCTTYIQQFVGPEPPRPLNWTRDPKGCLLPTADCADCAVLNQYLSDPKERVLRFATDSKRRRHIMNQLKEEDEKGILKLQTAMTDPSLPIANVGHGMLSEFMLVIVKTEMGWRQDLLGWKVRHTAAARRIGAMGSIEQLRPLLSDNNGRVISELEDFGLFETPAKTEQMASKPLAIGSKRRRTSEGFSKMHLLD